MDLSRPPSPEQILDGYPSYAAFIAKDKDAAIYRRFESLSARNILYLQSELHEIEEKLVAQDREDAKDIGNENAQRATRQWEHFANDESEDARARRSLQRKIRAKIKEYHEALILESQILSLSSPSPHALSALQKWFTSTYLPVLWGRDSQLLVSPNDLVALAPVDTDRLNVFLKSHFGWFFKEARETDPENNGIYYFPERRIQRAGAFISTLMSAVLLVGAIVCLLLISDRGIGLRVGMIVLFTCLFAGVVGLLTNARRPEIFGASAAYAAVLVVFVSNNLNSS